MIIVMGKEVTDEQIGAVVSRLEAAGLKANISRGVERTVIGAIGDERPLTEEMFTPLPGVESAMHIAKQYKIVSRESHRENTVIDIGGIKLGGSEIQVIAGPCSVETQEQMDLSAKFVHAAARSSRVPAPIRSRARVWKDWICSARRPAPTNYPS
jgi:3-deoxy-7-phosphoheptulonate synthase